ncbi:YebC/PmpR family DNA-binding transcriptional regulator [bacterium (Candidatus Gribaldobacteria) CG_4_8_14_3_um_filter_42_11]|uniref:Probable transcriptional regulatory protein COU03_02295 n=3 Tax=Candidatus Gribaldobacteria TaxID=2798536 RepID=A0A2H0UX19_9BACT|nr:MAG: YebC/PmpR family DNA-binding transcriptional regulator [bacterium (Candidatus Gribaldobacteria) CG10_big_fil_rev_8_21_14_0_10_41_12]PIV46847.1 MAG: YebC/PmpR family DNA-binding transcriptional regulator [bacterium (Candidatus Gribaldobacteria) CG02_land_8_20_14_3_00_41_15]PIX03007.1 MAG: YebC/PmpR family DNA-binding transcriptional regulator [bacterium (Candidatus Gribaldobacteria) CG_4_8_14_3_um_filter_42_11]
MSGHSHAKTVARTKDANNQKKGQVFSKIASIIAVAAKDGSDPAMNSKLRQALEEAKKFSMPKENIERAIKKGSGDIEGEQLEEVFYEAMGPNNTALVLDGITDNKNRALGEVRQILQKHNFKLADEGSVKWQFEQKGILIINSKSPNPSDQEKEEMELAVIEAGAEDIKWFKEETTECLEINTKPENLEQVKKNLEAQGIKAESSSLGWIAKEEIDLPTNDREKLDKLFNDLDDSETVQNIYSNLKV